MKLKFKHQEFQTDAVIAVADLFAGQEKSTTTFSVDDNSAQMRLLHNDFGIGNKLEIDNDTLLSNMHSIQRRHKLPLSRDYDPPLRQPPVFYRNGNRYRKNLRLHKNNS